MLRYWYMNTIIIQTIRMGVLMGVALFAFAGEAFASPVINTVSVVNVTNTSATFIGYVSNPGKTTTVWFEWSENSQSVPATIGMNSVYSNGYFEAYPGNMTPGTNYSYRAAAMNGGVTVYSPVYTFKTTGTNPNNVVSGTAQAFVAGSAQTTNQSAPVTAQTNQVSSQSVKKSTNTQTVVAKNTTTVKTATVANNTEKLVKKNSNTASVIGAGNEGGIFPTTLVGWIALMIAILVIVLISQMIYEQGDKRNMKQHQDGLTPAGARA